MKIQKKQEELMMHKNIRSIIKLFRLLMFSLIFILFSLSNLLFAQSDQWQEIYPTQTPGRRYGHSMVTINGTVFLFGGVLVSDGRMKKSQVNASQTQNAPEPKNDLWEFHPAANTWSEVLAMASPPARYNHSAVAVGNTMYVFGGMGSNNQPLNDMWEFTSGTNTWSQAFDASPPPARQDHTMSYVNGSIVISGGLNSQYQPIGDTWTYDTVTSSWTQGQDFPGTPGDSYGTSTTTVGGNIYHYGTTNDNSYYVYNPQNDVWETKTASNTPPSASLSASTQGAGYGFRFGGQDHNTAQISNNGYIFDPLNNSFTQGTDMPIALANSAAATFTPSGLAKVGAHLASAVSDKIILYGGTDATGQAIGRTFVYTPSFTIPVELSLFTATVVYDGVMLYWETKTESNNYGFEIERKLKDYWQKIGFVKGCGSTAEPQNYQFTDINLLNVGSIQYRLKQVDFYGAFKYSHVVTVLFNSPTEFKLLQNYPNPFSATGGSVNSGNPKTNIQFSVKKESPVLLQVYDIRGRIVKTLVNEPRQPGFYKVTFNAYNLPAGVYFYRIKMQNFQAVKKMAVLE